MLKAIILFLLILSASQLRAQKYSYYFIEVRPTGRTEVQIAPENGVTYNDIDTLLVSKRETRKNGAIEVTGKVYTSYSEAFNALSKAGLEFVQFLNLSIVGGGSRVITGDIRQDYTLWRKRIE